MMEHFTYRMSDMLARIEWSGLWPRCSMSLMSRFAALAAKRILFQG